MTKSIDWYYTRGSGCSTCVKAVKFFEQHGVSVKEQQSASTKLGAEAAEALLQKAAKLVVAKGKNLNEFTGGKTTPDAVAAMLGPTGNLRAPTLVIGGTVVIGFNQKAYEDILLD